MGPCDYCPFEGTDKCAECSNRGLSYGIQEGDKE